MLAREGIHLSIRLKPKVFKQGVLAFPPEGGECLPGELPAQGADRGYNYHHFLCVIKGVVSDLVKESFLKLSFFFFLFALTTCLET